MVRHTLTCALVYCGQLVGARNHGTNLFYSEISVMVNLK